MRAFPEYLKQKPPGEGRFFCSDSGECLFRRDRLRRTNTGACAAVNAGVGVNRIDIAGSNRLCGTFAGTATAGGTAIRINFVSHFLCY